MKTVTLHDYQERIVRSLLYIQDHLDDELELEKLACAAAFSRFHFHRIFRGLVGESVKEYVRRLRLERAARDLKRSGDAITEIAFKAGFDAHESFTRAFGEMFGVSPTAYRAAHQRTPESRSGAHFEDLSGYHFPHYSDPLPVEVKALAPMHVVFVRHVGPYREVGPSWGKLMSWAGRRGLLGPGMKLIGVVHDDPDVTAEDKLRYDAAVIVKQPVQPEGEFGVTELAGGSYAVATHRGPYERSGATYERMFGGWLPTSGYELRDVPSFEQYLNAPQNTRTEDLLTAIHIPVEKA
ncbi:MAG TPA: AraC family transcriptional regulator [Bryobacteraceae bacterium]|nr:AraC family transcriptional regulator [Bryobacteraceae bacterium]